jgi:hypothetical protein
MCMPSIVQLAFLLEDCPFVCLLNAVADVLQDVVRGLGISERTAVLAAAVSIDFD